MRTSGAADDLLMIVVPALVGLFVLLVLFGGPDGLLLAIDGVVKQGVEMVRAIFK